MRGEKEFWSCRKRERERKKENAIMRRREDRMENEDRRWVMEKLSCECVNREHGWHKRDSKRFNDSSLPLSLISSPIYSFILFIPSINLQTLLSSRGKKKMRRMMWTKEHPKKEGEQVIGITLVVHFFMSFSFPSFSWTQLGQIRHHQHNPTHLFGSHSSFHSKWI